MPPFRSIRRIDADLKIKFARGSDRTADELLKMSDGEINKLKKDIDEQKTEYDSLLVEAESERDEAIAAKDQKNAHISIMQARIEALELNHEEQLSPDVMLPASFEGLQEWAETNLAGSVVISTRAIRVAKKLRFMDVELAYRALLLLKNYYVPMRRSVNKIKKIEYA